MSYLRLVSMAQQPLAVVAIDFGSARSGYAFSFNDPENIICNKFDGEDSSDKICTCILLSGSPGNFQFKSFGNEANSKLPLLDAKDDHLHGFKYFKMKLFSQETFLESQNGARFPVVDVISYSLKCIAHAAINHLNQSTTVGRIYMDSIQWVVTVPAIWDNAAKQVMRIAAQNAGLPESLILALEPEAASLCCRYNRRELRYDAGTKYLILDCGGGTVDIAFHEIDEYGNTHELRAPAGGRWGSIRVDENFELLLSEIFGHDIIYDRVGLADVMESFEREKCKFSPSQKTNVSIFVTDFDPLYLEEFNHRNQTNLRFERRRLFLPPAFMASLFVDPINSIVSCVKGLVGQQKDLNYIFLVGGFANSSMLKERIIMEFENERTKVVIPNNPGMAVVEGAVHFGLNPSTIFSRHSAYTYGIRTMELFRLGIDPIDNLVLLDGVGYCKNVFLPFVKINQRVNLSHEVEHSFAPVCKGQKLVSIPLYASKELDCKYITPDMKEIGKLNLEIPIDEDISKLNIKVKMLFGGTEIKVRAEHVVTKKQVVCSLQFDVAKK